MRFLGFVFVLVMLAAAFGLYRGWFSFSTANATERGEVTVGLTPRARSDAQAAAGQIGKLSKQLSDKVSTLGKAVASEHTELRGTVTAVNTARRHVVVQVAGESLAFDVAETVAIVKAGAIVDIAQLSVNSDVRLLFAGVGEDRRLTRIESGQ